MTTHLDHAQLWAAYHGTEGHSRELVDLYKRLVQEETEEYFSATTVGEKADALIDMMVVGYGLKAALGHPAFFCHFAHPPFYCPPIREEAQKALKRYAGYLSNAASPYDADAFTSAVSTLTAIHGFYYLPLWQEVHRSNMAKLRDGKLVRREDGKILKPEGWTAPDFTEILAVGGPGWLPY
jgi:hypothetical protein